jgi:DNA polymerase III epsilon subunit-like protein
MRELCFIDVETTGAVFGHHEIIEIGVVRTSQDAASVKTEWSRRVHPRHPERISPAAREVNGYSAELWASAQEPSRQLWVEFADVVRECTPVCHNPSFDRAFITLSAAESGIMDLPMDYHWIGTESLGWPLYRYGLLEDFSLETLCTFLQVGVEPSPHSALGGARACRRVYGALMEWYRGLCRDTRPWNAQSPAHHRVQLK